MSTYRDAVQDLRVVWNELDLTSKKPAAIDWARRMAAAINALEGARARAFSDFIRNATPEEKAEVYGRVMDKVGEQQREVIAAADKGAAFNEWKEHPIYAQTGTPVHQAMTHFDAGWMRAMDAAAGVPVCDHALPLWAGDGPNGPNFWCKKCGAVNLGNGWLTAGVPLLDEAQALAARNGFELKDAPAGVKGDVK